MIHMKNFKLFGYDKDNDTYEELFSGSLKRVKEIGAILAKHQIETDSIRRSDNNEPFDWFVARNACDQDIMLFSSIDPDGRAIMEKPELKSDATKFETLKNALFNDGPAAVETFLGYKITNAFTQAEIYNLMDDVWLQMPWEELREFYKKYDISLL